MTARRTGLLAAVCVMAILMVAWAQAQQGRGGAQGAAPATTAPAQAAGGRGGAASVMGPGGTFGTFAPWVPDAARPIGYMVRNYLENPQAKLYNTAKQKLLDGGQINAFTESRNDPAEYCVMAPHYDFVWIEMQHSSMSFSDVEKMIGTCPRAGIPIIRVPDPLEGTLQKAMDIGALGVIVPQVEDAPQAFSAGRYTHYPPFGRRSSGGGQYRALWEVNGVNYRNSINDNTLVILMLESPIAADDAFAIASQPGVDVVIVGSGDMSSYSGYPASDPRYQDQVLKIHDAALKAGKFFGTASEAYRTGTPISKDIRLTQGGPTKDGWQPPARGTTSPAPSGGQAGAPAGR
jgi:2-keto-3-deoxy-L-rhamnonate aldolase RhmA